MKVDLLKHTVILLTNWKNSLTLSWRRPLSYKNQSGFYMITASVMKELNQKEIKDPQTNFKKFEIQRNNWGLPESIILWDLCKNQGIQNNWIKDSSSRFQTWIGKCLFIGNIFWGNRCDGRTNLVKCHA